MHPTSYRQVLFCIFIFTLLQAILILNSNLLPFQDLPNHLAEAAIYKYTLQGDTFISQYYQLVPWYYPNSFYLVFCNVFSSVELANKFFYILVAGALPFSIYLIIKELKGNCWYGLISVLFTYNYNVSYGFSGFSIAIPTLFMLFYVLLREIKENRIFWRIAGSLLLVLLFFMQAQMALFGLTLFFSVIIFRYRGNYKILFSRLAGSVPIIVLFFIWWYSRPANKEENTLVFLWNYFGSSYFQTFVLRLRLVFFDNFQLQEGWKGLLIASFFSLCIFLPLLIHREWKTGAVSRRFPKDLQYPVLFFLISLGCYIFLPAYLPGEQVIYQRFSPVLLLSVIIMGSILLKDKQARWLKYFSIILACGYTFLWTEYIYSFNRENRSFNPAFFDSINRQSIMAGLIYDNKYRGRPVYIQFPSYFIVWKKGIATSKIIDYRFGVIRRGIKGNQIPYYEEWPEEIDKVPTDYSALDYLLVKGEASVKPDSNLFNFYLFRKEGSWQIYKKKNSKQ
jgi:hypothetical protein